jgi:hypothetical protein
MPKFEVYWVKNYYVTGTQNIEADSEDEAREEADNNIGDWEGSMQYDPDQNEIEISRLREVEIGVAYNGGGWDTHFVTVPESIVDRGLEKILDWVRLTTTSKFRQESVAAMWVHYIVQPGGE